MTHSTLLDVRAVAELLQVKEDTVRWYHKRGRMPEADQYFGRTPVWKESTIRDWMDDRSERRGRPQPTPTPTTTLEMP